MNPPLPVGEGRVRVHFPDPEGNLLEFVCYDASVG